MIKMAVKLYKLDVSPPARAAMMACELFDVPVEHVNVNFTKGEQYKPELLAKNPVHTIPILEDGDLILHDSHAILAYLADAYGKQKESFYPKDVKQRALVNQKLFFNNSIMFPRLRNITAPFIISGDKNITEEKYQLIDEAYGFLEAFLKRTKCVAGDNITIADIATYATTTSLDLILKIDEHKYPKILEWHKLMEPQPYVQKYNTPGVSKLKHSFEKYLFQ